MGLSDVEKGAGRVFREQAQRDLLAVNEADPPTYVVPFFLGLFRHPCVGRGNRSAALSLTEHYVVSPIYPGVPAGRFGYLYREGRCRSCGQTARSEVGRLVDGWQRPPITGRVARG